MSINDPVLQHIIDRIRESLSAPGRELDAEAIQYGAKLTLAEGAKKAGGNIYHSAKKKRISWVPNGKGDERLRRLLNSAVEMVTGQTSGGSKASSPDESEDGRFETWCGTDEVGKGDLFGPIVVGGFIANRDIARQMQRMGVRDSKDLTKPRIRALAKEIHEKWSDRISLVEIGVSKYNEIYGDFVNVGGINGVLGWGHGKAIRSMMERSFSIEAAVVDKFGGEHRLKRYLPKSHTPGELIIRPRAESNMAVAAGAILARARYEEALDRMEPALGFRPHAGSGKPAVQDLRKVAEKCPERLGDFVKLHFAPVQALGID